MKSLKITLLLAVFVLTVSGQKTEKVETTDLNQYEAQDVYKEKLIVLDTAKKKSKPNQNI